MKRINLPQFDSTLSAEEQLLKHFVQCGINADWSASAYHLSAEAITGHKPNTTSGDFYLVENEECAGGWIVFVRIYADDRTDNFKNNGQDLIDEVVSFDCIKDAWDWLREPLAQAHYLNDDQEGTNSALDSGDESAEHEAPCPMPLVPDGIGPLSRHVYTMPQYIKIQRPDGSEFHHHGVSFGFGNILVGRVEGSTLGRESAGYPGLTISEAEVVAAELINRWNATPDLVAALHLSIEVYEATKRAEPTGHLWPDPHYIHHARRALAKLNGKS